MNGQIQSGELSADIQPTSSDDVFIRSTYRILFFALTAICALAFISSQLLPATSFVILGCADGLIWILCGWFAWRNPIGFVLPVFVIITGLFLGQLAHFHKTSFLAATIITPITFAGLAIYVHVTRKDFSFLSGFLWMSFCIMLGSCVLFCFIETQLLEVLLAIFGVFVFCCWILYDTSQILERRDMDFTPAKAAFELILDIVALQRWVMDFFESKN